MDPGAWVSVLSEGTTRPGLRSPAGRGAGPGSVRGNGPALRRWRRRDRWVTRGEALFGRRRKHPGSRACALRPIRAAGRYRGPGIRSWSWSSLGRSAGTVGAAGAPGGAGGLRDPRPHPHCILLSREGCGGDSDSHPRSRRPRLPSRRWMLWGSVPERGRGAGSPRCGGAMGLNSGRARSPLPR